MNLTLVTIAKFSQKMLWVVASLVAADLAALFLMVFRTGKVDQDEGSVVTEHGTFTGNALNPMGGGVNGVRIGKYVAKVKILVDRSEFISDKSLVDGTAAKSQRLIVHGIQVFFFLFWLLFVFNGLSLLPTEPIAGAFFVVFPTIGFSMAAIGMYRGRTEARRKLLSRGGIARG